MTILSQMTHIQTVYKTEHHNYIVGYFLAYNFDLSKDSIAKFIMTIIKNVSVKL